MADRASRTIAVDLDSAWNLLASRPTACSALWFKGTAAANAAIESFFSILQKKVLNRNNGPPAKNYP